MTVGFVIAVLFLAVLIFAVRATRRQRRAPSNNLLKHPPRLPDEPTKSPEMRRLRCSECGRTFDSIVGVVSIDFISPSSASARASGPGGYCNRCKMAFCGLHAVWKGMPGIIYNPYCPICNQELRGAPDQDLAHPSEGADQILTISDVARALFGDLPPAVLCGAGISADSPSNLPVARRLLESYNSTLTAWLAKTPEYRNCLPPLGEWMPKMRFEEVVSLFRMVGSTTEPIEPLNSTHKFNRNHEVIARLHATGCPVLTTNFDALIELAILKTEGSVRQLISREEFAAEEQELTAVAKLHGSFWRWDRTQWQDSRESLCTSIESVGGQFVQYSYNSPQKTYLSKLLSTRPLLVVGYSGTDDFDISSVVLRPTNRRLIVWVQHDGNIADPIIATSLAQVPVALHGSIPQGLFATAADGQPSRVVYLRGHTYAVLEALAGTRSIAVPPSLNSDFPVPPTSPAELCHSS